MSELKDKQWFIDRIGNTIFRDNIYKKHVTKKIEIKNKEEAIFNFNWQNMWFEKRGIYLNYRDEK